MKSMEEIRAQFPQYNDLSDTQLADALHKKFYSDMDRAEFDSKIGLSSPVPTRRTTSSMNFANEMLLGLPEKGMDALDAGVRSLFTDQEFGDLYDENRKITRATYDKYYDENPITANVSGIAGSLFGLGKAGKGAASLYNAAKPALPGVVDKAVRVASVPASGAAVGAVSAFGHDEDIVEGAGLGAVGGVAGRGLAKGLGTLAGSVAKSRAAKKLVQNAPLKEELKDVANRTYAAIDKLGVRVSQPAYTGLARRMTYAAKDAGIDQTIHPKATAALTRVIKTMGAEPTIGELDRLRKIVKSAAASIEPDERRIAKIMMNELDEFVEQLSQKDVAAGSAKQVSGLLNKARDNWSRFKKTEIIEELLEEATEQASSSGSGANIDNAIRQKFKSLLTTQAGKKKLRSFTQAEVAVIRRIVRGGNVQNLLRLLGKAAPTGIVSTGISGAAGHTIGGGVGAIALPVAGYAAKKSADAMTKGQVKFLEKMIRSGRMSQEAIAKLPPSAIEQLMKDPTTAAAISGATAAQFAN